MTIFSILIIITHINFISCKYNDGIRGIFFNLRIPLFQFKILLSTFFIALSNEVGSTTDDTITIISELG